MKRKKTKITLIVSILLIATGLAISTTNGYKFLLGYFMYKMHKPDTVSATSNSTKKPEVQNKQVAMSQELYTVRPKKDEQFGELYIPKLKAELPIFEGSDEDELSKGVGHYAQSVLPGENDNSVLSGHRITVFRRLGQVGKGDLLVVTTSAGKFTYKIKKVRIVDKDDRTVIVPKPVATLTVTTCYPFDFIGDAPKRYILVAYLLSSQLTNESKQTGTLKRSV
ncbi:class D sortase [Bacillus salipaludis]|uniref:class D sortase n=1 Tax=Bacillus salipaludis TaxID=2547811 RepID=UPI002E1AAE5C|nr:class D sortase [Bacillus salipaludis]